MSHAQIYLAWLYTIPGIGGKTIRKLMQAVHPPDAEAFVSLEEAAKIIYQLPAKEMEALLPPSLFHTFLTFKKTHSPGEQWEKLNSGGIRLIPFGDVSYPPGLRDIPDPPAALFVRGSLPNPFLPTIAVIGARMCSDYGRYEARQFGIALAKSGIQIVSGLALGIDGIAQTSALEAGGKTYAVLGSGVDVCYPSENRALYDAIPSHGGLISEYKPGTAAKSIFFPQRNRIISGLSDLVLVIEARQRSGTFITVDQALEQGKEVYALPGRICDRLSDGCNDLIRQGAGIATSPEDLLAGLYEIQGKKAAREESTSSPLKNKENDPTGDRKRTEQRIFSLTESEQTVFSLLEPTLQSVSILMEKMNLTQNAMTLTELMTHLVHLTLKGLAEQEGSSFRKK